MQPNDPRQTTKDFTLTSLNQRLSICAAFAAFWADGDDLAHAIT
jgi:hypothetical protein